jgi:hypothetical protein
MKLKFNPTIASQWLGGGALVSALLLAILLTTFTGGVASATIPLAITPTVAATVESSQAGEDNAAATEFGEEVSFDQAGFSFLPPVGWQVVQMEEDESAAMAVISPDETMAQSQAFLVAIGPATEMDSEADTVEELAEVAVASFDNERVEFSEPQTKDFNGFAAIAYDIQGTDDTGTELMGRFIISLLDQERVFLFMAIAPADVWSTEQVEAIYNTVRLFEPVEEAIPSTPQLGQEVTETVGDTNITFALPEGWEIIRHESPFANRVDATLMPMDAETGETFSIRIILSLDRPWLAMNVETLDTLVEGIVAFREAVAASEGVIITHSEPTPVEVDGIQAVGLDWERTSAEGSIQGSLVLALFEGEADRPVFALEASAPGVNWDSALVQAVLDSIGVVQDDSQIINDEGGFSFSPPGGWNVEMENDPKGNMARMTPDKETDVPEFFIGTVPIGVELGDDADAVLRVIAKLVMSELINNEQIEFSEEQSVEIAGIKAIAYDITGTDDVGNDLAGRFIMAALEDGRVFVAVAAAPSGEFDEDMFNSVVSSITFFEPVKAAN